MYVYYIYIYIDSTILNNTMLITIIVHMITQTNLSIIIMPIISSISLSIYIYLCMYVYIYIYIYITRHRLLHQHLRTNGLLCPRTNCPAPTSGLLIHVTVLLPSSRNGICTSQGEPLVQHSLSNAGFLQQW